MVFTISRISSGRRAILPVRARVGARVEGGVRSGELSSDGASVARVFPVCILRKHDMDEWVCPLSVPRLSQLPHLSRLYFPRFGGHGRRSQAQHDCTMNPPGKKRRTYDE